MAEYSEKFRENLQVSNNKIKSEIAPRKKSEDALRQSEEKLRTLFEFATDAIFILDLEGNFIDVNRTAYERLGYAKVEMLDMHISQLDPPEFAAKVPMRMELIKNHGVAVFETAHLRKDGTIMPVEVNTRILDYDGRKVFLSIIRDITERKRAEEALKKSEEELKRHREQLMDLVEERTSELQRTNERLVKESNERKHAEAEALRASQLAALGELSAGVAHEINNPINGIINYSQILLNICDPESKEYDLAKRIIKESDRIANIVGNLLSFARKRDDEKTSVNVQDVINDSIALTEAQLKKDGINLKVSMPSELPEITANFQQIQQIFLNVISNARYALNQRYPGTHENKVLEICSKEATIDDHPYIQVTFKDRGTGIPAEIIDKILHPFFTTKRSNMGTGLGLSISHGIISDHGGSLEINSVEGKFTEIVIRLPLK
jgi:PAS domain S-box-containing protein